MLSPVIYADSNIFRAIIGFAAVFPRFSQCYTLFGYSETSRAETLEKEAHMAFSINSPVLYVITICVLVLVLTQAVTTLRRSLRRADELGIDKAKVKKVLRTAAIFTIAPAVAIVVGVITLSKDLGIPLPWLRLSVLGSLSYETVAAANAESAMGLRLGGGAALTASQYVTIVFVMSVSIMSGIILLVFIGKRLHKGMVKREMKDKKWAEIFSNALFIGMITAFVGFVFSDVLLVREGNTSGLIPVFVFFISMVIMIVCGAIKKKTNWGWINDYALPISLIGGMACAIPLTAWLG